MKVGKIVSIAVCGAGVIALGAVAAVFVVFGFSKNAQQQNSAPPRGPQMVE
jgi:flagellar basal body-associated protein FliL